MSVLGIEGGPGYSASIGPLLLALIPGVLAGWRELTSDERSRIIPSLIVAGTGWLIWAGVAHVSDALAQSRLYRALFPALAILATAGYKAASRLRLPGVRVGRVLAALVALALGFVTWHLRRTRGYAVAVADHWQAQGITHVLLYDLGARLEADSQPLFEPPDWAELERLEQTELRLLQGFGGVYSLYELSSG